MLPRYIQMLYLPVAVITAVNFGPGAKKVSPDDAGGLELVVCLAEGARVMITTYFWVQAGVAIRYNDAGESPQNLPVAI